MRIKFWLGILISVLFLYFFARKIDWIEVWQIIKSVHYGYLLLALLVHTGTYTLRAQRWRDLLVPLKKISFYSMFSATIICFMGNNIFPARLGEIIRVYVLAKREKVSKSAVMATIVLERLMDGFAVLMFLIGLLWCFPFPAGFEHNEYMNPHNLKMAGFVTGGLYLGIIMVLILTLLHSERILQWLGNKLKPRFAGFYDSLVVITGAFVSGLGALKRGRHIVSVVVYSALIWLAISATFYILYSAFEINLSFASSMLLAVVIALAVAVPSSPGYVGTFHFACATCLILLGVEPNKAKSYAIILHGMTFIPVTISGLVFIYLEKINLKELQALENEA